MSYESPITKFTRQLETKFEDKCIEAVYEVGFDVNKEELAKALKYDRGQYDKGYGDGYNDGYSAGKRQAKKEIRDLIFKHLGLDLDEEDER